MGRNNMRFENLKWTREPAAYLIGPDRIEITTVPHTDLWQRTYYHFRNDNAPVLQMKRRKSSFPSSSGPTLPKVITALISAASCCIWTVKTG